MKKEMLVEIFAEDVNFVVVKVPSRQFPGVLIQGDSLHDLFSTLGEAINLIETDTDEAKDALQYLYDELEWRIIAYRKALKEEEIKASELPSSQ